MDKGKELSLDKWFGGNPSGLPWRTVQHHPASEQSLPQGESERNQITAIFAAVWVSALSLTGSRRGPN